ncbi:LPXTG cell wall anchor domain-containing protein [Streptomyces sp. LN785]|uniref:LPXTG cell wall anchor domain-containing protein n=1 Tax=Streptomyces sp. LN785 TaxID=3112983 RepID=UPI0037108186
MATVAAAAAMVGAAAPAAAAPLPGGPGPCSGNDCPTTGPARHDGPVTHLGGGAAAGEVTEPATEIPAQAPESTVEPSYPGPDRPHPGSSLPDTGARSGTWLIGGIAAALFAGGVAVVLIARRTRRRG